MHAELSYMDITCHFFSNGRWYATWFLTVENLCPLKDEALKVNEEAQDLRTKSYKSTPNSVANKKLHVGPITMNIKINIEDIVGKVVPNGIILKK
jgi:hypothetical protein